MLHIKIAPESNGAHENITNNSNVSPSGFCSVRYDLKERAEKLLPFVLLTTSGGIVTAIEDDVKSRAAWEELPKPEPTPTPEEDRDAMIADLAYRMTLIETGVV